MNCYKWNHMWWWISSLCIHTVSQWVLFEQQEMQLKPNMSPLWRCFNDHRDMTEWLLSHWLHSAFTRFESLFKLAQWWNVFLNTFSVFNIQPHTSLSSVSSLWMTPDPHCFRFCAPVQPAGNSPDSNGMWHDSSTSGCSEWMPPDKMHPQVS